MPRFAYDTVLTSGDAARALVGAYRHRPVFPLGPERDLLLSITYIVVLSSILLQGLSIGKLVKSVTRGEPQALNSDH